MHLLTSIILYTVLGNVSCSSLTTEYYKKLIYQKTAESQVYQLPQNNDEFRAGANSEVMDDFGTYDFIIVGAGSAGSVLATRLSEIEEWNILLLEAGGEEDDFSNIPSMLLYLQFSEMNWGYYTTPQTNSCLGMKDQKCIVPRGKAIGGSSAINGNVYVRGNAKDYDKWAELGNPGWSHEEVLPYFIKSENSQIDGDDGYHGKGGFWNVENVSAYSEIFSNFVDGSSEVNASMIDYNGRNEIGSAAVQLNIKHGRRQSLGTAFLDNARKRKNLTILTKALVTKVNIDVDSKVAQGVQFVTKDKKFNAKATKEVILSGGAINSPQILMLSGIGPKAHLEELEIEVIEDLPVGKNLLEHPFFAGLRFNTNYTHPANNIEDLLEEYFLGLGTYTIPENINGVGFIRTGNASDDTPTIEYVYVPPSGNSMPILNRVFNYEDELGANFFSNVNRTNTMFFYLSLLHEKSTGQITLKSSDPIDFPNIDLNMFAEQEDVDNLIEGIEFILNLTRTDAFKKINTTLINIPICTKFTEYSKQFWECVIRHMAVTSYHLCGTTAMGPNSTVSVVDTYLKVHGIENLRVVDAGIFPSTLSGHTNAPAVMVAEKIADVIKGDYDKMFRVKC